MVYEPAARRYAEALRGRHGGGLAAMAASHPDAETLGIGKLRTSLLPLAQLSCWVGARGPERRRPGAVRRFFADSP